MELGMGEPLSKGGPAVGMSETTARRYRAGDLPASSSNPGSTGLRNSPPPGPSKEGAPRKNRRAASKSKRDTDPRSHVNLPLRRSRI